jgi:leucyl-tRNA synthetase
VNDADDDLRRFAYTAQLAAEIEQRWQARWQAEGTFRAPNPIGGLVGDPELVAKPTRFVLDMFPYPSGSGLHVGHPLGYIATDVYARYLRMTGHNVLHTLGFDAFGLPAEHYAVTTGTHPRTTTLRAITTMRAQLQRLGLGHDDRRSVSTIDPEYYRWTQWIFLQIFDSWYDERRDAARPVRELIAELESGERTVPGSERSWQELGPQERAGVLNRFRLAYVSESPVNWCPGLGTVLANEEVTAEGRSERGNLPVFTSRLRQWNLRITAYADRLIAGLDQLDWPESIKLQQRNWIGRSSGALVTFAVGEQAVEVYTTRPDTLFGATYVVLAPEHPLVAGIVAPAWPDLTEPAWTRGHSTPLGAVAAYQAQTASRSERDRQVDSTSKTGVFTGAFATNPVNGDALPVFIADYVLMGYGTGAIMAVPAHDQRDFEFARALQLPVRNVLALDGVLPDDTHAWDRAHVPDSARVAHSSNDSVSLDGLAVPDAQARIAAWLESRDAGKPAVTYKLRDWLFSRQRYWGEPFPIVYDDDGVAHALRESMLPLELPEVEDYSPRTFDPDDAHTTPEAPLSRNGQWVHVTLDLGDGLRRYRRETNTMPNWAGSCWYAYRYLDPTNTQAMVDPGIERYWMGPRDGIPAGGVDLYVGGAEHAVLHLLYARFWTKVLFDLGHVSSSEPFHRLYNQGMIQAFAYRDSRGVAVAADEVEERDGAYLYRGEPVSRTLGKMGKSLKNSVAPDEIFAEFGADTLRLYEMVMGPLDVSRPWDSRAVVGQYRLLQRIWRNLVDEVTGAVTVSDAAPDEDTHRLLHRTIATVTGDMAALRFNTAIARITELNNHLTRADGPVPRSVAEPLVLLLAPLAPHVAEELWLRLGHASSLARADFPVADPSAHLGARVPCVLQVDGKVRAVIEVDADVLEDELRSIALADPRLQRAVDGREVQRVVVRPPKLVNVVVRGR